MVLPYCFVNGQVVSADKAALPVSDLGVLRGYAIFDYLSVHHGKPFLLDNHLERFFNSARNLNLQVPEPKEKIKQIIAGLISRNNAVDAGIRLLLTGGNSADGYTPGLPNFIITVETYAPSDPELYKSGVKLMSHEHQREIAHVKTINYITAISLQKEKEKRKAFDILYTFNGNVLELVRSNFFIVKGNTLITPKDHVLIGMTRNAVIRLAKGLYKVEERELPYTELKTADEAFFTGTTKRVFPVVQVDDILIGNGKPGPVTGQLFHILDEEIRKN